ncbi:MAG: hypothetical protein HA493_01295 [Candidatus Verstraetearchaeota archaeon]|nr:hypothetical protein [Candidatus Verstraetearchaeota archaeon]
MRIMEIISLEESINEIIERYNKKPKGWKFISDFKGNIIVIGPDIGYQLKVMMINPYESIGIGTRIYEPLNFELKYDSGFRILDKESFKRVISGNYSIIWDILKRDPVPTYELNKGEVILGGPILTTDIKSKIEEKLSMELEKLFRKKYPFRVNMFR